MNLRGKLTSLTKYVISLSANDRQRVNGAFCKYHVNSKEKQMGFGFKKPLEGEKRCVTTLITSAKETRGLDTRS